MSTREVDDQGNQYWYQGVREVDDQGNQYWYQGGRLHRIDGPAAITVNGVIGWWLGGLPMSFNSYVIRAGLSDEETLRLRLTYL